MRKGHVQFTNAVRAGVGPERRLRDICLARFRVVYVQYPIDPRAEVAVLFPAANAGGGIGRRVFGRWREVLPTGAVLIFRRK